MPRVVTAATRHDRLRRPSSPAPGRPARRWRRPCARSGARVILLEAAHHPRPKACAEYASPRIVEELVRIGLAPDGVAGRCGPADRHAAHRRCAERDGSRYADRRGPASRVGPRPDTGSTRQLAAHAAGRAAPSSSRAPALVGLEMERVAGRPVSCARSADGTATPDRAPALVVGADGVRSTVARLTGVERPVRFPRRLGLVAHYAGDHGPRRSRRDARRSRLLRRARADCPDGQLNVGMALPMNGRTAAARALRGRHRGAPGGGPAARRTRAPDADPRSGADRPSGRGRRRAGVAAGGRRRRVRRPVHRRGDPSRPAIGPGGRGRHRHGDGDAAGAYRP